MDIHKPKPFHSFRELLSEITVIVFGIVIALTLEQAVETIREHRNSAEAREAITSEIGRALFRRQTRMGSEACVADRLRVLGEVLSRAREGTMSPQPSWVSRPQFWSFSTGAWVAATAAGRAALLGKTERELYGYVYRRLAALEREEERDHVAWAHLRGHSANVRPWPRHGARLQMTSRNGADACGQSGRVSPAGGDGMTAAGAATKGTES